MFGDYSCNSAFAWFYSFCAINAIINTVYFYEIHVKEWFAPQVSEHLLKQKVS